MKKGKLYLFPVPLGEESADKVIPHYNVTLLDEVEYIIAENAKTARKWMKQLGCSKALQEFEYAELNEHTKPEEILEIFKPLESGKITAFLSEAGCPGIADPGADIARLCHAKNIEVIPLVGPSSILLALMASGFNGQSFTFNGYLPREKNERIKRLREFEKNASSRKQTQIFIETPYRNNALLDDMLSSLYPETKLCIASNITLPNQRINSKPVSEWKKHKPNLDKIPVVFLIY